MNGLRNISKKIPTYLWILLVSLGATAQDSAGTKPRGWGKEVGPYQLSISSDQDKYAFGDTIRITAILKNISDHSTTFRRMKPAALQFIIDLRLPMPAWIPWKPQAPLSPLGQQEMAPKLFSGTTSIEVKAGAEMTDQFEISKLFEMSAPGDYQITFTCRQWVGGLNDHSGAERPMVTITSNQIAVTVLPKQ
jgi:hypothetical protein